MTKLKFVGANIVKRRSMDCISLSVLDLNGYNCKIYLSGVSRPKKCKIISGGKNGAMYGMWAICARV